MAADSWLGMETDVNCVFQRCPDCAASGAQGTPSFTRSETMLVTVFFRAQPACR